jgi:type IV pilus assembly protein PilA
MQPPHPSQGPYHPPGERPKRSGLSCGVIALIVAGISVPLLGIVAALAIHGMTRYLAASKAAEAKNVLTAVARAASAAYEDRTANGRSGVDALCDSSEAVPSRVPSGTKYEPGAADYDTGDADSGWRCLRFSMATPQHYQYRYARGDYLGPADHGPEGFEIVARGDLDADGNTSLFVRAGRVENGELEISPLYVENEFE